MFIYTHFLLMVLAFNLASSRNQEQRAGKSELVFALLIPELYLAVHIREANRKFRQYHLEILFIVFVVGITLWSKYNLKLQ